MGSQIWLYDKTCHRIIQTAVVYCPYPRYVLACSSFRFPFSDPICPISCSPVLGRPPPNARPEIPIPNPNPNPNPSHSMDARSLTLTLLLTFLSPLSAFSSPSPSPSPSPGPSLSPPKQLTGDPASIRLSPPENIFAHHLPPPPHHLRPPSCPACHHQVDTDDRKLNFGQMMGIVLGGVAVALQVALGGFLVYKRLQLRKVERRGRTRLASSSTSSTA